MQSVSKMKFSFQVLIHRMINKIWLKFYFSHQTQFPILDLKELLGSLHCQNKVCWSFNQSQTNCEFSKTAPFPDILHQFGEPCLFLAQRLGVQKIENPKRASFQQFLILTVACLVSTVRGPALCRDTLSTAQLLHQGAPVLQSAKVPHRHASL